MDGTLYWDISPVKQAQALIRKLTGEGHQIYLATDGILGVDGELLHDFIYNQFNIRATSQMIEFIREFYPEIPRENILISRHKSMIKADALVDDNPEFLRSGSYKRILLDKPYNRDIDDGYFMIYRARNWADVENYIEEIRV